MGICNNCGASFTLQKEDITCDSCHKIVNWKCWNCNEWFPIKDDGGNKLKECKVCGFFICPYCNSCGATCDKKAWVSELQSYNLTQEQIKKIIDYIEEIKIGKDRRNCPKLVPISYAKSRIKSCIIRGQGYRVKNEIDKFRFKERLTKITQMQIGETITINQCREDGSYGQEYRDVLNTSVCYGWLKSEFREIEKDGKKIKYILYTRINGNPCEKLDEKNLFIMRCQKCKRDFEIGKTHCNICVYKIKTKEHDPGEAYKLHQKMSNKDVCQLDRGMFKKRNEDGNKENQEC